MDQDATRAHLPLEHDSARVCAQCCGLGPVRGLFQPIGPKALPFMNTEAPKSLVFPSKCDWWLKVLLLFVISVQLTVAVFVFIGGHELWVGGMLLLPAGFIAWILRSTAYVVDETRLLIRSGPFWSTVLLDSIEEVVPTHNPVSALSLSLDRLCVSYRVQGKRKTVMISPVDKEGFLRVLAAVVPGMVVDGEKAARAPVAPR